MTPPEELVLGVPRSLLMGDRSWLGIRDSDTDGTLDLIDAEGEYRARADAEQDPTFKQIIPYLLLRDRGQLFLMKRTRAGADVRLHDRWTIGIGGHLNPGDGGVLEGLQREFAEEMVADWKPEPRFLGLLNDDREDVGKVHLGVVFVAEADGRAVSVRETDKLWGGFVEPSRVREVYEGLETWSQHVVDQVSQHTARDRTEEPTSRTMR